MNEVTEKKSAPLPANMFEEDAAKGLGAIGQEDLALPFLKILGQLSPEVNKRDGKYVEGAEPGMIFNSVSGELYDGVKGLDVIPAFYKLEYIEWKDRGEGPGAPVAIYDSSSDIMSKTKADASYKDRLPNGNYIEKTASHFVISNIFCASSGVRISPFPITGMSTASFTFLIISQSALPVYIWLLVLPWIAIAFAPAFSHN